MVDLWQYMAPAVAPGQLAGRPVGVTHTPGGQAIFQAQFDAPNSRRVFHVKGVLAVASDWEELFVDNSYVYRAIDTSRPAVDGGPYTLRDQPGERGSKWARRHMSVGDVFERNPYVVAFAMASGNTLRTDGPVKTWLKLARTHANWHGVDDVIELHWLTDGPNQTTAKERYFYGRGLGLVGFEGPGLVTHPNHVWANLPPSSGVPVLSRKPIGFALPPLSDSGTPESAFRMLYPLSRYVITSVVDAPRTYANGLHEGVDFGTQPPGDASAPVLAGNVGVVEQTGDAGSAGYGKWVRLRFDVDGGEWRAWYAHMSGIAVKVGQRVTAGQVIGTAGATGNADGVHVHLTLTHPTYGRDGYSVNKIVDPLPYLVSSLPTPQPEPQPEPEPAPETGIQSPWMTADELRQLIAAKRDERAAIDAQISIYERALQRASA